MGSLTIPNAGAQLSEAEYNSNNDLIEAIVNGGLQDDNIASDAEINQSKLGDIRSSLLTFTAGGNFSNGAGAGITVADGATISDGGVNVTAGGVTVTTGGVDINAGGLTVAGGVTVDDVGVTVTAGGITEIAGGITCTDLITKGPWVDVRAFGVVGDGVVDDTAAFINAFAAGDYIYLPKPSVAYRISSFRPGVNKVVIGLGRDIKIDLFKAVAGSAVLVGIQSNCYFENLHFNSLETDLQFNRIDITGRNNVAFVRCKAEGFRNPANNNSWGFYIKGSDNILLDQCECENNTQSDIPILEGSNQVAIRECFGSALHINFEPNVLTPGINNVILEGMNINLLDLREPSATGVNITNVKVTACTITTLFYDGSGADFDGCTFVNFTHDATIAFMGQVNYGNSIGLSDNLVVDPNLTNITFSDPASKWKQQSSSGAIAGLDKWPGAKDVNTRYVNFNTNNANGTVTVSSKNNITGISPSSYYMLAITGRPVVSGTNKSFIGRYANIQEFTAASALIGTINTSEFRDGDGTGDFRTEMVIFKTSATTVELRIDVGVTKTSTIGVDVVAVTLHKVFVGGSNAETMLDKYHTLSNNFYEVQDFGVLPVTGQAARELINGDVVWIGTKRHRLVDDTTVDGSGHFLGTWEEETTDADIAAHSALSANVHGIGASTFASTADITAHSDLITGVHGSVIAYSVNKNAIDQISITTLTDIVWSPTKVFDEAGDFANDKHSPAETTICEYYLNVHVKETGGANAINARIVLEKTGVIVARSRIILILANGAETLTLSYLAKMVANTDTMTARIERVSGTGTCTIDGTNTETYFYGKKQALT